MVVIEFTHSRMNSDDGSSVRNGSVPRLRVSLARARFHKPADRILRREGNQAATSPIMAGSVQLTHHLPGQEGRPGLSWKRKLAQYPSEAQDRDHHSSGMLGYPKFES